MQTQSGADEPSINDVKYLPKAEAKDKTCCILCCKIKMVELSGFEPLTLCLQSRCSTN